MCVCVRVCVCVYVHVCVCMRVYVHVWMHASVHVCAGVWVVGLSVTTSCILFIMKTLDHEAHLPRQTGIATRFSTLGDKTSALNKATHASQ